MTVTASKTQNHAVGDFAAAQGTRTDHCIKSYRPAREEPDSSRCQLARMDKSGVILAEKCSARVSQPIARRHHYEGKQHYTAWLWNGAERRRRRGRSADGTAAAGSGG